MTEGVLIGVVAGILTSFAVVGFQVFWYRVVMPWYGDLIYKDAKIEGRWTHKYKAIPEGGDQPTEDVEESIVLKRKGHHVTGTLTSLVGPDKGKIYALEGEFRNLILTCDYSSETKSSLDRGNYCLILGKNGFSLVGISTYLVDHNHTISSCAANWSRKDA